MFPLLFPLLALRASAALVGTSTYTAPAAFPTSLFQSYYNSPTATTAQVQPVVSDPVSNEEYPYALTNPNSIPQNDTADPHPLPAPAAPSTILARVLAQIQSIATSPGYSSSCARCQSALGAAQLLALAAPSEGPNLAVALCEAFDYSSTCATSYGIDTLGAVFTQVVANADVGGYDGQNICYHFLGLCPAPPTLPLNTTSWFAKPKPNPLPPPKKPSGERLKVLHLSDFHIDPRYAIGAEADCSTNMCCRTNNVNAASPNTTLVGAPRFGAYSCDSPLSLVTAALQAIPVLAGPSFDFTIFTGDLVSHDPENQLSRSYVEYAETLIYGLLKRFLGPTPVYAVLGNHDTYNQAQDAPHSLGVPLSSQFQWNYDHVASLWQHEDWLSQSAVADARAHYAAYAVQRQDGLRVITLNTDFWYTGNYFNFVNMTDPDVSGMLRFLTDELQDAEETGERVWIVGHVLSGWDGSNALLNPTNLFYQIVDRYTPHVIANIFWGHTHEDQLSIFYTNNGTNASAENARTVSWMGPSITPLSNLNSGFRVYEVDSSTFDILDAHTWRADVNTFPELDAFGPAYAYEYNTRATYGGGIQWGATDPLNATWWHLVTEAMEANSSLVTTFNTLQGKSSVKTAPCTGACATAKICYMRSGSASIALENCDPSHHSVQ